jgi:hypothetical protein
MCAKSFQYLAYEEVNFVSVADNERPGCSLVVRICRREEGPVQTHQSLNCRAGGVTVDRDERRGCGRGWGLPQD